MTVCAREEVPALQPLPGKDVSEQECDARDHGIFLCLLIQFERQEKLKLPGFLSGNLVLKHALKLYVQLNRC